MCLAHHDGYPPACSELWPPQPEGCVLLTAPGSSSVPAAALLSHQRLRTRNPAEEKGEKIASRHNQENKRTSRHDEEEKTRASRQGEERKEKKKETKEGETKGKQKRQQDNKKRQQKKTTKKDNQKRQQKEKQCCLVTGKVSD